MLVFFPRYGVQSLSSAHFAREIDAHPFLALAPTYLPDTNHGASISGARFSRYQEQRKCVRTPKKDMCVHIIQRRRGVCSLLQLATRAGKTSVIKAFSSWVRISAPTQPMADIMLWKQVQQHRGEKSRCRSLILFSLSASHPLIAACIRHSQGRDTL